MADVTEHRSEQPERTDRKAVTQGQPANAPRLLHVERYNRESQVRQDIMNGDVLMFRGDNILSGMIQVGTGSPYSHAGIVFRSDDLYPFRTPSGPGRVYVVEAVGAGIRMDLLSETVAHYHGAVELWRLTPRHLDRFDAAKAVAEARRYIGRPYAFAHLFYFLLDWLTFKRFDLRSHTRKRQSLFCSQLVSRAYVRGGVDLCKLHTDAGTTPADLISEGRIEPIHAFSKRDPLLSEPAPSGDTSRTEANRV